MGGLLRQHLDLPLGERTPTRWLGWLAAGLVGLAVIAAALAAAVSTAASREALAATLVTVLLPPGEAVAAEDGVDRLVATLSTLPGVAFARPIVAAELGLGGATAPLPRVVDVALNPGHAVDLDRLGAQVAEIVPGATVAPAGQRAGTVLSAGLLRDLALAVGLGALTVLGLGVAGLTRLSLVLHRETIDVLRQLGADDRFIARQLGQHALGGTLRGGFLGYVVGVAIFLAVMTLAEAWLPPLAMAPLDWLAPSAVPPLAAILAGIVADLAARPARA